GFEQQFIGENKAHFTTEFGRLLVSEHRFVKHFRVEKEFPFTVEAITKIGERDTIDGSCGGLVRPYGAQGAVVTVSYPKTRNSCRHGDKLCLRSDPCIYSGGSACVQEYRLKTYVSSL